MLYVADLRRAFRDMYWMLQKVLGVKWEGISTWKYLFDLVTTGFNIDPVDWIEKAMK